MVEIMATREKHYQKFGPLRSEAAELVLLKHINILRENQGMPTLTQGEYLDLIENHLSELEPYDWMKAGPPGG